MLALGILAIGVFLIFAIYLKNPSKHEVTILSEDIMDFFANSKIQDINNKEVGLNGEYWNEQGGEVEACYGGVFEPDTESTLLQIIGEFYDRYKNGENCLPVAEHFIQTLTANNFPKEYLFEFRMNDELLYPETENTASKEATKVLIPSKKIVYGYSNKENGDMFGPYYGEVLVWRQSD